MNHARSSISGFNLTELMVVVAVAGVLAVLAIPGFTSLSQSQRVKNASFELYSLFNLARSEAIKRNASVTITPVMDGSVLNRIEVTAPDGTLLYSKGAPKRIAIYTAVPGIVYQRSGRTTAAGMGATFQIDDEDATEASPSKHVRCITLGLSGVPNARMGAC